VIGTIVGIILLGKYGRRPMILIGFIGVATAHAVLAASFLLPESGFRTYLILAAMLLLVAFVQTFIGTLVWLLPPCAGRRSPSGNRCGGAGRRSRVARRRRSTVRPVHRSMRRTA
jgi:hypothetical protein